MPRPVSRPLRKKVCVFCKDKTLEIDYKDTALLRKFVSDRGKIRPRGISGSCRRHQRDVAVAVKNARELALLPYAGLPTAGREPVERPRARSTGSRTGSASLVARKPASVVRDHPGPEGSTGPASYTAVIQPSSAGRAAD